MVDRRDPIPRFRLPGGLAPLGYREYALFWIGHTVSTTGRWILLTGAVWLVYELTESPVLLGLLGVFRAVPAIMLSSLGGVIADRFDQRRILFVAQACAIVSSVWLGALVLAGTVQVWNVY